MTRFGIFCQYSSIDEKYSYSDVLERIRRGGVVPLISWEDDIKRLNGVNLNDLDREKLMVYPIGGVYCGLWRRDLIIANNVWFPEGVRYEDNYWGTMIKAYVRKVIFVEKVGYYYRQNSMSTVHKRNQEYQFDRIEIENSLIHDLQARGLLDRFRDAEEYLYVQRYAINSFWLFLSTFDIVPKEKIHYIISDLKRNVPMWGSNPYYRLLTPMKGKVMNRIIVMCPSLMIAYWRTKQKIKSRKRNL